MKKILTIDDQKINLITIKAVIESNLPNCEVLTARSGQEGIETARKEQPDTIILDIVMPGMDGFEACKILKQDELTKHIPVVMITAIKIDKESRIKGLKAGADSFLSKPIDPDELAVQVNAMLRIKVAEDKLRVKMEFLNQMILERTNRLSESMEGFREMADLMPLIIYEHDLNTILTFSNIQASALLGYSQKELGQEFNVANAFVPGARDMLKKDIEKILRGEIIGSREYTALRKDGTTFPILVYSSVILKGDKPVGVRSVVVDITERKNVEEELSRYARQLEERNEELDTFSHSVAHDLKNPLGAMMGFANLLLEEYPHLAHDEVTSYLDIIIKSGKKNLQIINSLLLFSSLRKSEIHTEKLNMDSIIDESIRRFPVMIKESGAQISLPNVWPYAVGYAPWIEEVWANYLSNAFKYGGHPPRIEVGAETIKTKNIQKEMVRFWVRDYGPGISAANQKLLFRTFERLDQVKTDGYGLGLSIVRRIVEKLGGNVGLKSEIGKGSLFYFTLPSYTNEKGETMGPIR